MVTDNISFAQVMDTMAEGVFVLDASCCVVLWNRAMTELTGWRVDEMVGSPAGNLVCTPTAVGSGADEAEADCALLEHVDGRDPVRRMECTLRTRGGDSIPVLKNAKILSDDDGAPVGVVVTLTDLRPLRRLQRDLAQVRQDGAAAGAVGRLVGHSAAMREVYERIRLAAESDATVLILGETGTGKELVADAIHYGGRRAAGPFVKVNCSALPENLLESELFGHVQGAFTGAAADRVGRIELAEGGTLFLDEIGDLSPMIQLKLLRVLQEREYERVGETTPRRANVRFVAATHRNLRERVETGGFRRDFFYRIRVFSIDVPPLRRHRDDLSSLTAAFIDRFNQRTGKRIQRISDEVMHTFMTYCWPGNVRELENAIEHAFVTCNGDCIQVADLPHELRFAAERRAICRGQTGDPAAAAPAVLDRDTLAHVLRECEWNQSEAARRLGVHRTTVWRKVKQWGLRPDTG